MKHQTIAKQIKEKMLELKVLRPEIVIFDGSNIWISEEKRNEEKYKKMLEIEKDEGFPELLYNRGFVNYVGMDMNLNEIFIGGVKCETRKRKDGSINEAKAIRICNLSSKSPTIYRVTKENPLAVASYGGEDALIIGLKYNFILTLLDYLDCNIKWRYNPESMAYCDGSEHNLKNQSKIVKSLEYIMANLNLLER